MPTGRAVAMVGAILAARTLAPQLLDRILASALPTWFTRRAILQRDWSGFSSPTTVGAALRFLAEDGFLESDCSPTGGRSAIRYRLANSPPNAATIAHLPS